MKGLAGSAAGIAAFGNNPGMSAISYSRISGRMKGLISVSLVVVAWQAAIWKHY